MISTRDPRWKTASDNEDRTAVRSVEGATGEVIPSKRWKHKQTGATASLYGAVPWTGAPGDRKEDWHLEEVGWTISWPDGTIGIGRPPFKSKAEAEKWVEEHPRFPGMNMY